MNKAISIPRFFFILLFLFFSSPTALLGQDSIKSIVSKLLQEDSFDAIQQLNSQLKGHLISFAESDTDFRIPLTQIEGISTLYPQDSSFRLINWNLAYSDGTYTYECGIQHKKSKIMHFLSQRKEAVPTNFLFTGDEEENQYSNVTTTKEDWIGALYYEIIQTQGRFNTYYTLLGWDGNDLLTDKKIIDVLWFNKANEIKFGAPIFKSNTNIKSRIIFEYGGQNSMRLYTNGSRIIMDHLSPPPINSSETTQLEGIYEYYGSDLSFDGLDWENGYWVYKADIDPEIGLKKQKKFFKPNKEITREKQSLYPPVK